MSSKKNEDVSKLILSATDYLKNELRFTRSAIYPYRRVWKQLITYMESNGILSYDERIEKKILFEKFKDRTHRELTGDEQYVYNGLKRLTEFKKTGRMDSIRIRPKYPLVFQGALGEVIKSFISYKDIQERISWNRMRRYQHCLFNFLIYCNTKKIESVRQVDLPFILLYIKELKNNYEIPTVLAVLRSFVQYLYSQEFIDFDYARKIPKYKTIDQPKLPSIYSKDEIERLLAAIDRSSPKGKRNYAIVLIAVRLGLRASDIANFKFGSLHWETSAIKIRQIKTGNELALPLLPDVGNAIIDYLKFGRPQSETPYIFLMERPPYNPFKHSNYVTKIVQQAFRASGINIRNRKFGAHSLRHTLGFRMLEESMTLPVISEVFGHENTESTKFYLRVDLKAMRQCVLDVPPIHGNFYEQIGGALYE